MMWKVITVFLVISGLEACVERNLEFGKVCVCNSTYCDTVPRLGALSNEDIKIYWTSRDKPGFNVKEQKFTNTKQSSVVSMVVNANKTYQKILGFGGAFTDSNGYNINMLPAGARKKLMESFFGDDGIEYNFGRIPIGGADFAPSWYTLDDTPTDDMKLEHFALNEEDLTHKIPFIKEAVSLRKGKQLKIFGAAWVVPKWMLYAPDYIIVKETHYQVLADYYKKYLDEYTKNGVEFWALSTGNEPANGFVVNTGILGVPWSPRLQAKWLRENLGPTIRNSSHKNLKFIFHDDSLESFPYTVPQVINDGKTLEFLDGVATHWYYDNLAPLEIVELAKSPKKDLFLMNSEACYFITRPFLGDWGRAASYVNTVIEHLEVGYNIWVDWNLAVNSSGGPNNRNWNADAPVVLSHDVKEFYKQPYYYAIGHFSKFVIPDSLRINVSFEPKHQHLKAVAFLRPDNLTAVILYNINTKEATKVQLAVKNKYTQVEVPAASFQTILFSS